MAHTHALEPAFANIVDMGLMRSEHTRPQGQSLPYQCAAFAILYGLLIPGFILYAAWFLELLPTRAYPWVLGIVVVYLPLFTVVLHYQWKVTREWMYRLAVFDHGLAWVTANGYRQVRWDDIENFWERITEHYCYGFRAGRSHHFVVGTAEGRRFVLRACSDGDTLGDSLRSEIAARQIPKYLDALERNEQLSFAPVGIDRERLRVGARSIRWGDISRVTLIHGVFRVYARARSWPWAKFEYAKVCNAAAMAVLIEGHVEHFESYSTLPRPQALADRAIRALRSMRS